tara:strand:- start:932 stop:1117 length:186 start_codon:yes stop_codon:yes gene_type:complete
MMDDNENRDFSAKMTSVEIDINSLLLEQRQMKEAIRDLKESLKVMAERLAKEHDEPLIKWT